VTGPHPAQFSPEVLTILEGLIRPGERIHDPFAGPGLRLGKLCDGLGAVCTGTDIEEWPNHDPRVKVGDARDPSSYPPEPFTVVTSPVYGNKRIGGDYSNGPTARTITAGRVAYGIALGRPLHHDNLARVSGQRFKRDPRAYWEGHAEAVKRWRARVLLNVDQPLEAGWRALLDQAGCRIVEVIPAYTRRNGGFIKPHRGAGYEVVIVAVRDDSDRASPDGPNERCWSGDIEDERGPR
jgi:hypothetical protein